MVPNFEMTMVELCDAREFIDQLKREVEADDPKVSGMNCGETNGQIVFHIHLIPRRKNDTRDPRGGVRGVIPDKMAY